MLLKKLPPHVWAVSVLIPTLVVEGITLADLYTPIGVAGLPLVIDACGDALSLISWTNTWSLTVMPCGVAV